MLKSTLIGACLAVLLGGCATHTPSEQRVAANNPECIKSTGTRIEDANRQCVGVPGSTYTQEDLQRTGEIDAGLRRHGGSVGDFRHCGPGNWRYLPAPGFAEKHIKDR